MVARIIKPVGVSLKIVGPEYHQEPVNSTIGIVIPTLNEEKNIENVLVKLNLFGYNNILVIDGLSTDGTINVAEKNGAKTIFQDGKGKGQAIRQVLKNQYLASDILVFMDADGSMSAEEVHRFVKAFEKGADIVKGSRFLLGGGTYDMTAMRKFGNFIITKTTNLLWSTDFTDLCYGFFAVNKRSIQLLSPILESNKFEIEAEIVVKAKMLGLSVVEIPSVEYKRKNGQSNLNSFRDGFKILRVIIKDFFAYSK